LIDHVIQMRYRNTHVLAHNPSGMTVWEGEYSFEAESKKFVVMPDSTRGGK